MRICYKGLLFNIHLVGLSMLDRHMAEVIYNMLVNFLTRSTYSKHELLSASSDGENAMTEHHAGLVTRIERWAEFNGLRLWCAPHQIDIIV